MSADITGKVLDELSTRRIERQAVISAREREIREGCPEIKAIDVRIARCCLGGREALPDLLLQRQSLLRQWLVSHALPEDWLSPAFGCSVCQDSGYAEGKLCVCVRNEAARRMFSEAGLTSNSPSFERFDLTLFSADIKCPDGHTVREYMEFLRDMGISYANRFPGGMQRPNLLFTGKPGLGKSYLMDCIAGRVIARGLWVVRVTAYAASDTMAKALFDRADPDSLFDCDLLALDDLGAEPLLNKVTISSLFNLLNERTSRGKPFLVSTNLTPEEILQRYGDRVFSRMTDQRTTRVIEFQGVDLRRG